jgi:TonB family protein
MGVRAVKQRDSRRHRFLARDERLPARSPENPLGDLPKIVEKMSAAEVDSVLRLIAQQARLVTAATGAAIALGARDEYFCRATAGDKAPPLGARIRSDSGLTGECLRLRLTLRCDDAEKDDRVDAEACRELQVRSLAVVPIRLGSEIAGVLEVFSHHVSAFSNTHVATLERVAELVAVVCRRAATLIVEAASEPAAADAAQSGGSIPGSPVCVIGPAEFRQKVRDAGSKTVEWAHAALDAMQPELRALRRLGTFRVVAMVATLLLLIAAAGFLVGRARRQGPVERLLPAPESAAQTPSTSPLTVEPPALPKPSGVIAHESPAAEKKPALSASVPRDTEEAVVRVVPGGRLSQSSGHPESDTAAAPEFNLSNANVGPVSSAILAAPVGAPKLIPPPQPRPISQGVVPGHLLRKVNPPYPIAAREARIQGAVVLNVSIQKNGKVGQVRILSGHPLLAQAAVQAVKGWVYEPFRLNGEPVDAETQVTVNFSQ